MEKSRKPKIRFKGFTDDWEQRKFRELYSKSGEKNDGSIGINKNITVATMQFKGDVKVSTPEYLKTYYTFNLGDIAFEGHQSKEFRYGRFVENDIGNGIVSHIFSVFRSVQEYDLHFWKYAINNEELMQNILSRSTKASTMMHDLVTDDFLNETFLVPSLSEQEKVGSILHNLDNLITLHQRKLEKLMNVKKSMLEKMFPKRGSDVPEIRFFGFTDAWEQRKVRELGMIYIGLVTTMTSHYTNDGILLIRNSDIKDGRFEFGDNQIFLERSFAKANESRMHQLGDVITVHTGDVGTSAVITKNEVKSIGFATIVTRPNRAIINPYYLCTFLNTEKHKKWAVAISTGDGRTNYNLGDYLELIIPVPSINEQKEIALFIEKINTLITLHQRKLEKLKNIKKSMLEKMFI